MKTNSLPKLIRTVILDKGTEKPYSGEYDDFGEVGTYLCRQCGLPLFRSQSKFHSGCGWPSFDEEIPAAVRESMDVDGRRTEILCARCQAHLGHVFTGEGMTLKNTRHCVNSLSLDFVADLQVEDTEEAIFAGGCFWGIEDLFKKLPGVIKTQVGYSGGQVDHPSYEQVCTGQTGHYEVIRVIFDTHKTSFEAVTKYFLEIHDPSQQDGQGPDIGQQYQSVIFYYDEAQKRVAEQLMQQLQAKGYRLATQLLHVSIFWPAELYHQDYYAKTGKHPYCHQYTKRF